MGQENSTRPDQDVVAWLKTPGAYPHRPQQIEHVETHISHVFLAGPLAYKLKKPVRFEFLDFSTLAAREQACREELRLNRRLAAEAYLDVVAVTCDRAGALAIGGDGKVVDWLVKMQRLPAARMLDAMLRGGQLERKQVDEVADRLTEFYAAAERPAISAADYRQRLAEHIQENRQSLRERIRGVVAPAVDRVHGFQLQLLHLKPELFDRRVEEGRIVDGHGDLRAEHICLTEPIAIFDCIEFRSDFRQIDVADELAFLAADCDFLSAGWIGPQVFWRYTERSGDRPPGVLWNFYKSYRAAVRAKVGVLRASQLQGIASERAFLDAVGHLDLADRYLKSYYCPLVIVVGGLSGTGKSTLARELARRLGAEHVSSDVVRKLLQPADADAGAVEGDKYAPQQRQRVYDEMLRRAGELRREQLSVVLDATFAHHASLEAAQALAQEAPRSIFLAVECVCPPALALERIANRLAEGKDASEAGAEVYAQQAKQWSAWPGGIPQVRVDTAASLDRQVQTVLAALAARCPPCEAGQVEAR